jgi:hypothetical protein
MVTPANVIEGATVTLTGVDEFGIDQTFELDPTDAAGNYVGDVLAGTYDIVVSMDGYQDATLTDVVVAYGITVTNDFSLYEIAYPVAVVTASTMGDNILIEWSFDAPAFVLQIATALWLSLKCTVKNRTSAEPQWNLLEPLHNHNLLTSTGVSRIGVFTNGV